MPEMKERMVKVEVSLEEAHSDIRRIQGLRDAEYQERKEAAKEHTEALTAIKEMITEIKTKEKARMSFIGGIAFAVSALATFIALVAGPAGSAFMSKFGG